MGFRALIVHFLDIKKVLYNFFRAIFLGAITGVANVRFLKWSSGYISPLLYRPHTHTHTHTHARPHTHTLMHAHTHTHTTHTHTHTHARPHTHTHYTHTHTHSCTPTHTHSCTHTQPAINDLLGELNFDCPGDGFLTGLSSVFTDSSTDRVWQPNCCTRPFASLINCQKPSSTWNNVLRDNLNFTGSGDRVVAGLESFYFNK